MKNSIFNLSDSIGLYLHKDYNNLSRTSTPINYRLISLNPSSVVVYSQSEGYPVRPIERKTIEKMKKSKKFKGNLSDTSKRKVQSIANNLFSSILSFNSNCNIIGESSSNYLSFATLTLSATQYHSDEEIKRNLLNDFLIQIKRKFQVEHYIWIAESQKNGNIHFHLILDRYINWKSFRNLWNKIQSKYLYIDLFELKNGHRNPNSTDIKAIKFINMLGAYLTKYVSKDSKYRKIIGRLWSCSRKLRFLKALTVHVTDITDKLSDHLHRNNKVYRFYDDYFAYFSLDVLPILKKLDVLLYNKYILHNIYNYSYLYDNIKYCPKPSCILSGNEKRKKSAKYIYDYLGIYS